MAHLDFANRLAIYGYKHELEDFDNIIATVWNTVGFHKTFKTVERLLCDPIKSMEFCSSVKRLAKIYLDDEEILTRLLQLRKSKFLKRWHGSV